MATKLTQTQHTVTENMMVDVMVKSKKDAPPKLLCLEMLLQCSFFRLKELKKFKKVELRRSLLYRKWQALRGSVGRRKQKKQNKQTKKSMKTSMGRPRSDTSITCTIMLANFL